MPNNPLLKPFDDEILDVKKQSLYARLKRLFSTDVIVRNVGGKQLKIKDTDNIMYATDRNSLRDRFNRIRSTAYNAYTRDFALSYQAARMDLFRDYDCVGPDTIIPLPDGTNPTIAELAEKYKDQPQERFLVFSYDHETDSIKLGKAYHPRKKKGTRYGYKVTFDDGQYVIGSIKHPFLMRNGEYKRILELEVGDSVMPFYQHEYGYKKNRIKPYRKLYNFSKGYQSIHKIVAEQFNRPLEKNEVVHHKDFNGFNNSPENLQIMDWKKHNEFHSNHSKNVIWGKENYENQLNKLKSHPNYINRKFHRWNGERQGKNNPFYGKIHTILSNEFRSKTLKEVFSDRDQHGEKNPKYRDDLTIDVLKVKASDFYKENGKLTLWGLIDYIRCDYETFQNRLKWNGTSWEQFKEDVVSTLNHKVVSIECIGPIEVYDVTVEEYHNFATDSCFVKNTMDMDPIISCIFADTYISTLEGFVTIKDLAEKYSGGECFKVWSWDKDEHKLTLGNAHHPRKTGTKNIIEIHLDNGEVLKCTPDHRIMLIDGTYKKAGQLSEGESLMPFYHRINKYYGYQEIKSLGSRFKYTHRYIFENIFEDTDLDGYNIHHKNHNKLDNRIENLEKITAIDHCRLHGVHPVTTGKRAESCKQLWANPEYRKQCSSAIKRWQNSDEGKRMMSEHTTILNQNRWKNDSEYVLKMSKIFSDHAKLLWNDPLWKEWKRKKHSETMKLKYANDPTLKEKTKHCGNKNGKYKNEVTTESVLVEGIKYGSLVELARVFDFKGLTFKNDQYRCQFLSRRIKEAGYKGWIDYKNKFEYSNHKVTKIIDNNEITDVYDLTVDFYENFAVKQGMILSNSALDIYADECLTYSEMGKMLTVHSNNHNVKQILDNLFTDILNIQFNLWSWTRNMAKYGDFYLKLYITPEYGIYMVEPISAYNVERIENADPFNKRYVKFQIRPTDTAQSEVLENYEVAHFRLISDSNFLPYGKGMIEGARRVWKQLSLMEDAMLIHRIMRAPEKRIFYTDIGNIPPSEVDAYMEKMMGKMKKVPYMDEMTGEYNLRFNLQNMVEDYYIPVRGGDSGTKIDTLGGMEWTGTEDIEYLKNKMMAALKIPKAFLGYEEGISGKATLASEDVRFARTIQRIQRIITSELTKIAIVHLYAQGYRDESLVDFELELTNPSTIFEKEKIEIWTDKVAVATDMVENKFFSYDWTYKNIFNMSEDDIKKVKEQVVEDAKQRFRFTSIEEEGDDPAKPFKKMGGKGGEKGGGGDMGDLGGGSRGGGGGKLDLGDEEEGEEGGEEGGPDLGGLDDLVKETKERDQTGEHQASSHPFGEDPLGDKEIHEKPNKNSERKRKSEISHNYEEGSPLVVKEGVPVSKRKINPIPKKSVDSTLINSLSGFLAKSQSDIKKELIRESESTGSKSMLDEKNILPE